MEQPSKASEWVAVIQTRVLGDLLKSQQSHVVVMLELGVAHAIVHTTKAVISRPQSDFTVSATERTFRENSAAAACGLLHNLERVAERL